MANKPSIISGFADSDNQANTTISGFNNSCPLPVQSVPVSTAQVEACNTPIESCTTSVAAVFDPNNPAEITPCVVPSACNPAIPAPFTPCADSIGPEGPPGPPGPAGPPGPTVVSTDAGNVLSLGTDGYLFYDGGVQWLSGTGAPAGTLGDVGDFYIDLSNGDIYIKTGTSTWTQIVNTGGYVPYTGAIQDVDLGVYKLTADAVEFSLTPTNSPAAGQIVYEGNTGALAYLMNNSAVKSSIGQTLHAYVHNADSVTILKGQPVYIFGASGNKASVKLAANTSDSTSAKTLGLAAEDITSGQKGFVTCQGVLDGLNTGMYSDGDILYVGATAGTLTTTKPYAPNHLVYIGVVERANAGNGQIYVRAQNGYELDEIHDVDLISVAPVNNDILTYVTGSPDLWKPKSIAGILGYTPQEEIIKIIKSGSNQTTTSATAQNITQLLVTNFEANKTYLIYGNIQAACNNTGGVKLGFTVPSGATGTLYTVNQTTGTTSLILALANENTLFGSSVIRQTNATRDIFVYGRIEMGSTTGTVQFTFASNTTGETSTIFGGNNSMITFIKMN